MKRLLSSVIIALACTTSVHAADCARDHPDDYEAGVSDGREDGSRGASANPMRHGQRPDGKHKNRWTCYENGYEIGYANASADRNRASSNNHHGNKHGNRHNDYSEESSNIPRPGSNEREYYDDGCRRGRQDGQNGMSSVYERYDDEYDRRFEPFFAQGYEDCWRRAR